MDYFFFGTIEYKGKNVLMKKMDVILCLYSRYCNESVKFLKELEDQMEVRKLCVDHEKIRKRLLDSDYGLTKVPIVLIFHNSGEMEKIEGKECTEWLNFVRKKLASEAEPPSVEAPVIPSTKISVEKVEFEKEPEEGAGVENAEEASRKKSNEGGILNRAQQLQKERVEDTPPLRNPMD